MARKKKRARRKTTRINVPIVETGVGLLVLDDILPAGGRAELLKGNFQGALATVIGRARLPNTRNAIIRTLAAGAVAKIAAKSFKISQVGSLGPIKLKI